MEEISTLVLDVEPGVGDDFGEDEQQRGRRGRDLYPSAAALAQGKRLYPPLRRWIVTNAILVPEQKQVERREDSSIVRMGMRRALR